MPTVQTGVATEFINFSRASNATVTDSNGLIEWAPHNLLLASEQFDASSWTKGASSVTGNSIAAPNGSTTADTLVEDGTAANHRLIYTLVTIGARHTFGVFLKAGSRDWAYLRISDGGAVARHAYFNLSTGAIGTVETNLSAQITSVGSGWYLCTVTVSDANAGSNPLVLGLTTADNTNSHAGNGTGSIHVWGAHVYRSDLGGMQANTSAYPMYNPTTPKNLLGSTEDFSAAAWTKTSATVSADSLSAPNGLNTSDTLTASAGTVFPQVLQATPAYATAQMVSVYAKAGTYGILQLFNAYGAAHYANFNLSAGVVGTKGASVSDSGMVALGNGWYRCWAYFAALDDVGIGMAGSTSATKQATWATTGSETIYLWGAQLSDSASLDPYSPNHFTAPSAAAYYGPRRDFDSAGVCRGLLVEEQRTNLLLYSAAFDDAYWTKTNATITANNTTAPDGSSNADLVTVTGASGRAVVNYTFTAAAHTLSVFLKYSSQTDTLLRMFDGTNTYTLTLTWSAGVPVFSANTGSAYSITNHGNGWYRVSLTATMLAAAGSVQIYANGFNSTGAAFFYGAQLELGSFATSYIPTTTASATRSADVAQVSTAAFPYSATEGTVVVNASSPCIAAIANMITLDNGTTQERIRLLTDVASVKTIVTESNTTQANLSPGSATANTPFKFAVAYKVNDFAAVVNGSAAATDAAGNVPVVNIARFGADSSGNYLNGHIRQITYLPRRISNAELQSRTA